MTQETLNLILQALIVPIIGAVASFVIAFLQMKIKALKQKTDNEYTKKYLDLAANIVVQSVDTVSQTFVSELKRNGTWSKENAQEAFCQARDMATSMISESSQKVIESVYGDFEEWMRTRIEQAVLMNK